MSSVTFRHEHAMVTLKDGKKTTVKENIIDGEKGLTIMFLKKKGDDFYKLYIRENEPNQFSILEKKGDKETTKDGDMDAVKKVLKGDKDLKFAEDYLKSRKKQKGGSHDKGCLCEECHGNKGQCGGALSKKSSKKGSKKSSRRKTSKKGSKRK